MINYTDSIENITPSMLEGFFKDWPNPPSLRTHLRIIKNSFAVVLAIDDSNDKVIGFITAISDGILFGHITLLEVLHDYRCRGIGKELVSRMLEILKKYYSISLMCDKEIQPFYARFGMATGTGMNIRNYERQSG